MSDFRIRIQAELDAKNLTSQINALKQNKIKIPVEIDFKNADIQKALSGLNGKTTRIKPTVDTSGIQQAKTATDSLRTSMAQISKFQFKVNTGGLTAELSKLKSQIDRFGQQTMTQGQQNQVNSIITSYQKLEQVINEVSAKSKSGILNTDDINRYNAALKTAQNQVKVLSNELSGMASATDRIKLTSQMQAWLNNNTKATKEARAEIERYIQEINSLNGSLTKGQLNGYANSFKQVNSQMVAMGKTGKSFADDFKQAFGRIFQFAGAYGLIQNVIWQIPRQMAQAVKDINAAQIELRKVSEASNSQLAAYWDEAAASAQKYGATISDVISSTADWSRLGYNLEDSKILSDLTTLYQRVGDNMTQESASEALISTLQGYQMTADQAKHIVDAFNEVGNKFAIGSDGIGEALQRSASSMYAANNTMEETIGLVTAANTVVQDPDSVGTAFKTISMRIRGATTELEEAGLETEGMAESTASLRKEIMALSGVDIMQDENTFKSTYDILDELATKWSDLTDIQQANSCLYVQKCA